jgi:hypothetical protein
MSDATPIVLTLDADADPTATADLARVFLELGVEATLMLSASTASTLAADHPLTNVCKRLDVGLIDRELTEPEASTPKLFQPRFEKLHDALLFPTGRLPSVYACPGFAHGAYATLSEVNIRAVMTAEPIAPMSSGFFLGGRLHLPPTIALESLTSGDDVEAAVDRIQTQAAHGENADPIPIALPTATSAVREVTLSTFLKRLLEVSSFAVRSVRQTADLFADVPYDHAIPMAAITAMAMQASQGNLSPYQYTLGWLSPAEQLYILAHIWSVAMEKGKAPRNSQTRTPIPTLDDPVESTVTTISAAEFPTVIAQLVASMSGKNELPAGVAVEAGVVAVQDLLPTLAVSLPSMPTPTELVVVCGASMFAPELVGFGRLAWTYKPATR